MRRGKLSGSELQENVLDIIKHRRDEVLSGAALGEDSACFKSKDLMLISTDPITGADKDIGSLAIKVASNDIYASGGEPFLAMLTIIAPTCAKLSEIKEIMIDAEGEALKQNIEIVGGHTEFSDAVTRFVLSTVVVGKTKKHIMANSLENGDYIIVTKSVGLEGTVILSNKYADKLSLTEDEIECLAKYSEEISLEKESSVLKGLEVSSMHDITEGGIYSAVAEICEGSGVGAIVYEDKVPISQLTKKICFILNINPFYLISSGSLLITTTHPKKIIAALEKAGIAAVVVGRIEGDKPYAILSNNEKLLLTIKPDELVKI